MERRVSPVRTAWSCGREPFAGSEGPSFGAATRADGFPFGDAFGSPASGPGIVSSIPIDSRLPFNPFIAFSSRMDVPRSRAIRPRVSPFRTTYVPSATERAGTAARNSTGTKARNRRLISGTILHEFSDFAEDTTGGGRTEPRNHPLFLWYR